MFYKSIGCKGGWLVLDVPREWVLEPRPDRALAFICVEDDMLRSFLDFLVTKSMFLG